MNEVTEWSCSEWIMAEIGAGMLSYHALTSHDARQGKLRKHTGHSRSDAEVIEYDQI